MYFVNLQNKIPAYIPTYFLLAHHTSSQAQNYISKSVHVIQASSKTKINGCNHLPEGPAEKTKMQKTLWGQGFTTHPEGTAPIKDALWGQDFTTHPEGTAPGKKRLRIQGFTTHPEGTAP